MANHKSAEKRARQNTKRAARNVAVKSALRSAIRAYREALAGQDKASAAEKLKVAARSLRRAATKGVMHQRTVSRRVSRLEMALAKMG